MQPPTSPSRWLRFRAATAECWAIFLDAVTYWPFWPYYRARHLVGEALAWARWTYFPATLEACDVCWAPAQWDYAPAGNS